jgi:hypothetical protein
MLDPIGRSFPAVGRFILKVRIVLFFALVTALWFGIRHFDLSGMIAVVVVAVLIEKMFSLSKILRVLEVERTDFYLLKNVGKSAAAALAAGAIFAAFYFLSKDFLLAACLDFSRRFFALIHFEKVAAFFGGSLFLGICFIFFGAVYLFGAIEPADKEKLANLFRKFTKRRAASDGEIIVPLPNPIQNLKSKI